MTAPAPRKILNGLKFDPNLSIDASVKTAAHQTISVQLQVIEFANETYTIVFSLIEKNDGSTPQQ